MNRLGIRVSPKVAYFFVVDENCQITCSDTIKVPQILEMPERLKFIRNNVLDIINQFNVKTACIRVTESASQNLSIDRIYIEAVIQEAFSSSNLEQYAIVRSATIKSRLQIDKETYKSLVKDKIGEIQGISVENFKSSEQIEALLAALIAPKQD